MNADWKVLWFALLSALASPANAADLTLGATSDVRVQVRFVQTEKFTTTIRDRESDKRRDATLTELGKYVQQTLAPRLAAGQSVQLDVLDLKRAGSTARNAMGAAGGAGDTRIIRDTDPPRIDLGFKLLDASGTVLRAETRKLRDMNFMMNGAVGDTDPLRYEKRLLDDWVDQDFPQKK